MSLKAPLRYSGLQNTGLNCLISCFPLTLFNYRNRKVTYFYRPIFSKRANKTHDSKRPQLQTANPVPSSYQRWTYKLAKSPETE